MSFPASNLAKLISRLEHCQAVRKPGLAVFQSHLLGNLTVSKIKSCLELAKSACGCLQLIAIPREVSKVFKWPSLILTAT